MPAGPQAKPRVICHRDGVSVPSTRVQSNQLSQMLRASVLNMLMRWKDFHGKAEYICMLIHMDYEFSLYYENRDVSVC